MASASLVTSPPACAAYPETAKEPLVLITHNRWRCWFLSDFPPNIRAPLSSSCCSKKKKKNRLSSSTISRLMTRWKLFGSRVQLLIGEFSVDFKNFFSKKDDRKLAFILFERCCFQFEAVALKKNEGSLLAGWILKVSRLSKGISKNLTNNESEICG